MDLSIFIAHTPNHIVLSHLIREQKKDVDCHLILLRHAAYKEHEYLIDFSKWDKVYKLLNSPKIINSVRIIDKWIYPKYHNYQNRRVIFYLGNDIERIGQVIVSFFKKKYICLYEDGIGSYVSQPSESSFYHELYRILFFSIFMKDRFFNCKGLNKSKAKYYYALSDSAFPSISRDRLKIIKIDKKNSIYLSFIMNKLDISHDKYVIIASELLSFSKKEILFYYNSLGKIITSLFNNEVIIWFKKHPRETDDIFNKKLLALSDGVNNKNRIETHPDITLPIELIVLLTDNIISVLGFLSSSLLTIKHIKANIDVFSYLPAQITTSQEYKPYESLLIKRSIKTIN